ncbi:exopolysaccharide biosynthesis ExoD family domain-containing protein [Rhizobium phaseoli]|nr:exopolysaccharide biosynthesis ExoD family domain-containing protein [Rhizobium phaseoli]
MATARLREMLELARAKGGLSIGEALETMGRTSIAFTILFLAIPALTPIPGPFGMVFGTALALVSLQIVAGGRKVWLPAVISARSPWQRSILSCVTRFPSLLGWRRSSDRAG